MFQTIPEFPDYEINKYGIIRRLIDSKTSKKGKIIKSHPNTFGYLSAILRKNRKGYRRTVHSLVAQTFLGDRPKGMEINHKDGIRTNCHVDNLEYCTSTENKLHANRIGLGTRGSKNGQCILTEELVVKIRSEYVPRKVSQYRLAKKYGVSRGAVCDIVSKVNWKWI